MSSMYPPYEGGAANQVCQRCRTPLAPNEVYCSNCGYYNAPASSQPAPSNPGVPWGSGGAGGYPPTTYGQPYAGSGTPSQWGQSPTPAPTPPPPSSPGYYGGAPSATPAPPSYQFPEQGGTPYPPPSYPQVGSYQVPPLPPSQPQMPERPRGGPNFGLIALIAVVVLVLVLGGLGVFALTHRGGGNTGSVTPTPAQGTSTTTTATPLFSDNFANNNHGWDLTSVPGRYSVKLGNGQLVLEEDNNRILPEFVPGKTFDDFRLEVDVAITKGTQENSGFGVYIRASANQNTELATYYRFAMYGDSTYAIFKGMVDSAGEPLDDQKLVGYLSTTALKPIGQVNHVQIIAKGSTMTLAVNGQTLNSVTDSSYKSGSIALYVSNLPDTPKGVVVAYSNLAIYPAS
ncbi:family 16 glycoside hydrolase [Thermogemmatispora sp.]|uniref:family 16 glycoside hydrolase n=1 Tax=Thermogemmatispora sp. TaxID=1968838 RepID=UPI0035E45347